MLSLRAGGNLADASDSGPTTRTGGNLQASLRELAWPLSAETEAEVFNRTCDYVDELKELRLPPERVVIAVKRAANEAGVHPAHRSGSSARLYDADKLRVDMVRWCVERYYRAIEQKGRFLPGDEARRWHSHE